MVTAPTPPGPFSSEWRPEPAVVSAELTAGTWRIVLAVAGACDARVALPALREALAIAAAVEDADGVDLTLVDPDDARFELRAELDRAGLQSLDVAGATDTVLLDRLVVLRELRLG